MTELTYLADNLLVYPLGRSGSNMGLASPRTSAGATSSAREGAT